MTFPSDYKIVQIAGGTTGQIALLPGLPRQTLVNTTTDEIHVMDGVTPGGFPQVGLHNLATYLQNNNHLPIGTKAVVEVAGVSGQEIPSALQRSWSANVMRELFDKFMDTTTAGTWKILNAAMPAPLQGASKNILDLDDAIVSGFYVADPSATANLPSGVDDSNTTHIGLVVIAQSTDNVGQILIDRYQLGRLWTRALVDGVWEDWVLASGVTSTELNAKLALAGGTMTGDINMDGNRIANIATLNGGPLAGRRNAIINGDFNLWQRGTSQTISGYASADRWNSANSGSTKTTSRQAFAIGQSAVPGNPKYYSRTVVVSSAGAPNYALLQQPMEGVSVLSNKKVTVTFWAKADSTKDIAIEMLQSFGTGGSPSTDISSIGVQRVTLSTGWQRFDCVIDLPSVSGKTLGSNNNDYTGLVFWFDAGSNHNARTSNLGQQSGTFDLAHISVSLGDCSEEDDPFESLPMPLQIMLARRYYQKSFAVDESPAAGNGTQGAYEAVNYSTGTLVQTNVRLHPPMRIAPTVTTYSPSTAASSNWSLNAAAPTPSVVNIVSTGFSIRGSGASGIGNAHSIHFTADAEL